MSDDLISRQAAIDALGERPLVWDEWTDEYALGQRNQYDSDKLAIETVPSAERHGRWEDTLMGWKCSVCGEEQDYASHFKHCINCGASMDEVDE